MDESRDFQPRLTRTYNGDAKTIKSEYEVTINGEKIGEVFRVFGRSFSGAWRAVSNDGSMASRLFTREEAVNQLVKMNHD